ncbi:MAG: hypothetical protein RLZ98_3513, partial [Pseudomonadota bacterium]
MLKTTSSRFVALAAGVGVTMICAVGPVAAESASEFFAGKKLRMVIGSGAGGGYDGYARFLVRHMERHIPGKPSIVVQNMPGASGIVATNYMYHKAERDGTVMGGGTNATLLDPLFGSDYTMFDPRKIQWIGSTAKQHNICVAWHDTPFKTIEDTKKQLFRVSTTGLSGNSAKMPLMLNQILGTNMKVIAGFTTPGMRLALERKEADGICGIGYFTWVKTHPHWIKEKKISILLQGGAKKIKELPNVPRLGDLVTDPKRKQALDLLTVKDEIGRPYFYPPEVPKFLVAALRSAFDNTMKDKQFLAEAEKTKTAVSPLTGAEISQLLEKAYT